MIEVIAPLSFAS